MLLRLGSAVIIGFWLVMTGLLVRMIWFPESSRQAQVPPRLLYDVLAEGKPIQYFDIWQGRDRVGTMNVTCDSQNHTGVKLLRLIWDATLEIKSGMLPAGSLSVKGAALFDAQGDVMESDLDMHLSSINAGVKLSFPRNADLPAITFMQGGRIVFESSAATFDNPGPVMEGMLAMAGVKIDDIRKTRSEIKRQAEANPVTVRRGRFELEEREFQGFVLHIPSGKDGGWRLYFTDTGEQLAIDTPLDYRIRAESLRPKGFELPPEDPRSRFGNPAPH